MKNLYSEFVHKLKKLFGKFDADHKRFEKSSNSEIARELGYSDAQFSRLINQTATDGEYARANQNADRILKLIALDTQLKEVGPNAISRSNRVRWIYLMVGLIMGLFGYFLFHSLSETPTKVITSVEKYDMLKWSFETSFVDPYTNLKDLPEDCHFPCYK